MSADPMQWWRDAIAGRKPMVTTTPECGFFVAKIGGKMIPARIYWEGPTDEDGKPCGDEVLCCEVGGVQRDPDDAWLWLAKRPVEMSEYVFWLSQLMEDGNDAF